MTAPVVGATKLHHIEGAAKALDLILSEDKIAYLEEPYIPHALVGVRHRIPWRRQKRSTFGLQEAKKYREKKDGKTKTMLSKTFVVAVANEKNLTRAAEILHVTQPTLSRQIKDLENELGTVLLIRGKRSLTLTNDGRLFRKYAEDIVEIVNRAEREFLGEKGAVNGLVAIGATEALGGCVLAKIIKDFSDKYPDVQFELFNAMADNIKEKLDSGLLDLGLLLEPVDTAKYEFTRLSQKETWGVLVNSSHRFARRKRLSPSELAVEPLILPNRPNVRGEILHWIGCDERQLKISVNYNLLSNAALLVEEGMGAAVCLDGALAVRHSARLRFIPFVPEHTTRSVLVWRKDHLLNPAAALFVKMALEYIENG